MRIEFLGGFRISKGNGQAIEFRSDSERALLAYLILENNQHHSRVSLSTLLWPETSDKQSRNNLRVALHRMRQALGKEGEDLIQASNRSLGLNGKAPLDVDVHEFLALLERSEHHRHSNPDHCPDCIADLEKAVALYRGPLLKGFNLDGSLPFQEWQALKQEWLHRKVLDGLYRLVQMHIAGGNFKQAELYARRQLELEAWREKAHRQLMLALAGRGERSLALAQYQLCSQVLEDELGVEPADETRQLYAAIRSGEKLEVEETVSRLGNGFLTELMALVNATWVRRAIVFGLLGFFLFTAAVFVPRWFLHRNEVSTQEIYDDFEDDTFTGGFNTNVWALLTDSEEGCTINQEDGALAISQSDNREQIGCALRARRPLNVRGADLGIFRANMLLRVDHNGGDGGTVLRYSTNFNNGAWSADCGILAGADQVAVSFVVTDTRLGESSDVNLLMLENAPIDYETWYEVELAASSNAEEFVCLLNGEPVGIFHPSNSQELAGNLFLREIGAWRGVGAIETVLIDDVVLDQPLIDPYATPTP